MTEKKWGKVFDLRHSREESVAHREKVIKEQLEMKNQLLEAIKEFYYAEKKLNPDFQLTIKSLLKFLEQTRGQFSDIKSINGLLYYFNRSLDSLKIAMGIKGVED